METYITQFKSLNTAIQNGKPAPHKAILLLSVIDLIDRGELESNHILLSDALRDRFKQNWRTYINDGRESNNSLIRNPFKYMNSEPFWESLESANEATIDKRLYELLLSDANRNRAKEVLREKYLGIAYAQTPHKVDFAALDAEKDQSLRPYQKENKQKIYNFWTGRQSVMLQMPTGTGKTRLFVSIVKDLHEWGVANKTAVKVLLLAHRVELIQQISENLGVKYRLAHGIIASKNPENIKFPIQVGSVPTMHRRMDKWAEKDFDVIIVDEAHHVKAESYRTILKEYPNAKVLGVTATPYRLNGAGFRDVFQDLILSDSVATFIKNGYLSNYDYYSIPPDSYTQKQIEGINEFDINGDYNERAMMQVMDTDRLRARIVDTYQKYANGKKGIIYTINQLHNENVCEQFKANGITAKAIDSKTDAETRKGIVNAFRNGKFQVLCNVNIFSEGFDCPDLEFVQLARPTKSLSMFLQQIGRGLRTAEGKEKVIFLDNVGLYNRFGLPSANRKWRKHFEGQEVTEIELKGQAPSKDQVRFMDDIEEGDERVELVQSTLGVGEYTVLEDEEAKELESEYMESKEASKEIPPQRDNSNDDISLQLDKINQDIAVFEKYGAKIPQELKDRKNELEEQLFLSNINQSIIEKLYGLFRGIKIPLVFELKYTKGYGWEVNELGEEQADETTSNEIEIGRTLESLKAELAVFEKYGTKAPVRLIQAISNAEKQERIEFIDKLCGEMEDRLDQLSLSTNSKIIIKLVYEPKVGLKICEQINEKESISFSKYLKSIFSSKKTDRNIIEEPVSNESLHRKIEVVFEDGVVIRDKYVKQTMVKTIRKIGVQKVMSLNLSCRNIPLISTDLINENAQVEIEPGLYLMTYISLDRKKAQLEEIAKKLGVKISVKLVDKILD